MIRLRVSERRDYPGYPGGPITSGHRRGRQEGQVRNSHVMREVERRLPSATLLTPRLEKGVPHQGRQEVSETMNSKKMYLPWDLQKENSPVGPFQNLTSRTRQE